MIIIGNPDKNNSKLKNLISNLEIDDKYLKSNSNFRNEIIDHINNNMCVLDIGKSMRDEFKKINCKEIKTLDINIFDDYPDIQFDLSETVEIEKTEILLSRYTLSFCEEILIVSEYAVIKLNTQIIKVKLNIYLFLISIFRF